MPVFSHASRRVVAITRAARLPLHPALSKEYLHLSISRRAACSHGSHDTQHRNDSFNDSHPAHTFYLKLKRNKDALCKQSSEYVLAISINVLQQVKELHMRILPNRMHLYGEERYLRALPDHADFLYPAWKVLELFPPQTH